MVQHPPLCQICVQVLELPKGKRAAIRSIPLLHPDQRWALIPSMIAIMLAKRPSTSADSMKVSKHLVRFRILEPR